MMQPMRRIKPVYLHCPKCDYWMGCSGGEVKMSDCCELVVTCPNPDCDQEVDLTFEDY